MTNSEPQQPRLTADDLLGAWECFKGDGIHGWSNRVLVFWRDGGRMVLEFWLPTKKGKAIGELRLFNSVGVNCFPTGVGLRLLAGERTYELWPTENGTFMFTVPHTTAGATYFRKTTIPKNRVAGD